MIICLDKNLLSHSALKKENIKLVNSKDINWLSSIAVDNSYVFIGYYYQFTYKIVEYINYEINIIRESLYQIHPIFPNTNSILSEENSNERKGTYFLDDLNIGTDEENLKMLTSFSYDNIVILAHGEGIHLKLGNATLCALSGDQEQSISAKIIAGGCSNKHCRRLNQKIKDRIRCSDVKSNNLYLLSCNSGIIAGDLYFSSSSLVRSFLESCVKNVLGCIELHNYSKEDIKLVKILLSSNYTIHEICYLLNQIEYIKNFRSPFCVYGRQILNNERHLFQEEFVKDRYFIHESRKATIFRLPITEASSFYAYKLRGNGKVMVWLGNRICILANEENSIEIKFMEPLDLLAKLEKGLIQTFIWSNFWLDFFSFIQDIEFEQRIQKILDVIKKKKESFVCIKNAKICNYDELKAFNLALENDISNFEKSIMKYFVENVCISSLEKIYFMAPRKYIKTEVKCNRCNHACYNYIIEDINRLYSLNLIYCGTCGIRSITPDGYQIKSQICKSKIGEYSLSLSVQTNDYKDSIFLVYIEIYDKAKAIITQRILKTARINNEKMNFPVQWDLINGKDLHTYRGIILSHLEPIYFKGRFSELEYID